MTEMNNAQGNGARQPSAQDSAAKKNRQAEVARDTVVSVRDARKSFGQTEVLKGISLDVERGEVVAVIGPSGGG